MQPEPPKDELARLRRVADNYYVLCVEANQKIVQLEQSIANLKKEIQVLEGAKQALESFLGLNDRSDGQTS